MRHWKTSRKDWKSHNARGHYSCQPASNCRWRWSEQVGTRPALVVHEDATSETLSVIMIVPFTSNTKAQRFPHTILVQPSKENGLKVESVLLVFQLRAIDRQRVARKIGHLENELIEKVNREMKSLLGLN